MKPKSRVLPREMDQDLKNHTTWRDLKISLREVWSCFEQIGKCALCIVPFRAILLHMNRLMKQTKLKNLPFPQTEQNLSPSRGIFPHEQNITSWRQWVMLIKTACKDRLWSMTFKCETADQSFGFCRDEFGIAGMNLLLLWQLWATIVKYAVFPNYDLVYIKNPYLFTVFVVS